MGEYNIITNIDRVDVASLEKRLGSAFAKYTIGQIKELPEDIQQPVFDRLIKELESELEREAVV